MRRSIIFALLCIICLISMSNGQAPTNKADPKDYVDPRLPKPDKKIWQNLLGYYVNARQLAKGTLKEVSAVSDFCWASYRYVYAIERAANRAQIVWDNLKNFQAGNPVDAIVYAEEQVFQNSDALFYHDIPEIKKQQVYLDSARSAIRNRTGSYLGQIGQLLPNGLKFKMKYLRLMDINGMDVRALVDTSDRDVNYHQAMLSEASKQIAATEINNEQSVSQSAMLESGIKNGAKDGNSDPQHQSEYSKVNEKNTMILSLQENVQLGEAVKTGSYYLLSKVRGYSNNLEVKKALLCNMEGFSDALLVAEQEHK
jgi:hypothetical protein